MANGNDTNPLHCLVVSCLVRNNSDEVLLIRHHRRGWEVPQGRVEQGEDLIEALRREVQEEAGVEIMPGPLAAVWSMVTPPSAVIFGFLGTYASGTLASCDDSEEACWASPEKALEMVTSPTMRDRLQTLLHYNGTPVYRAYTVKPYQVQVERDLL